MYAKLFSSPKSATPTFQTTSEGLPNKKNIPLLLGLGAEGRKIRFDGVKLDNLFFGVA
ncbi:hypothetical protein [Anabaena sp. PCC 7108]|uniref:hypothetical protein n=1 Tax=Anabaena sp. PCC 7108 TaxID=163908 RepID=UPI000347AC2E|nr:hypothetical protein [Anabaena sp. PCC 7108]